MKAKLSIRYLILIVLGAIAMATVVYIGNNLAEDAMYSAYQSAMD